MMKSSYVLILLFAGLNLKAQVSNRQPIIYLCSFRTVNNQSPSEQTYRSNTVFVGETKLTVGSGEANYQNNHTYLGDSRINLGSGSNKIFSRPKIDSDQNITLKSENSIYLEPEFTIEEGAEVNMFIDEAPLSSGRSEPENGIQDFEQKIFKFYPNPMTDTGNFEFTTDFDGKAQLDIYSSEGKIILEKSFDVRIGLNRVSIDLSDNRYTHLMHYKLVFEGKSNSFEGMILKSE